MGDPPLKERQRDSVRSDHARPGPSEERRSTTGVVPTGSQPAATTRGASRAQGANTGGGRARKVFVVVKPPVPLPAGQGC